MARKFSPSNLEKLRGLRTQSDLAFALRRRGHGTTQTTVSRWESGQEPRAHVLADIAAELGVTVDALFEDDEDDPSSMALTREAEEMVQVLMPRSALRQIVREEMEAQA